MGKEGSERKKEVKVRRKDSIENKGKQKDYGERKAVLEEGLVVEARLG